MPFRSAHISKRAAEKAERVKQLEAKEKKSGPSVPAQVNVYHSNQKLVVAKSTNHLDLSKPEVNNLEVNHPIVSKPSALNELVSDLPIEIQPNTPVVNGEVRADLVVDAGSTPESWHPVITTDVSSKKKSKGK